MMKLNRASSYALHAVVFMASEKPDRPLPSHVIARAQHIPERFLVKVLKPLVAARVLMSVTGPNGGYRLAKPMTEITLLEVIEAVDGPIRGEVPFTDGGDASGLYHRLEVICSETADQVRKHFGKVRIKELVGKK
jgi:Rrf2 family protein